MSDRLPAWTRSLARIAAIGGVLFAVFAVRVVWSAQKELSVAETLRADGELDASIVHFRRAARWYAPGSPYHVRALAALLELGAAAERDGDVQRALAAYRAARGAILSARSFYVPERDRLQRANARIADLMATLPPPPMDAGKSREALRAEHLALLSAIPGPKVGWTLVLLLGFVGWVGGSVGFTLRAIDADDRFVPREVARWGGLIVCGFGLFVLGMVLA